MRKFFVLKRACVLVCDVRVETEHGMSKAHPSYYITSYLKWTDTVAESSLVEHAYMTKRIHSSDEGGAGVKSCFLTDKKREWEREKCHTKWKKKLIQSTLYPKVWAFCNKCPLNWCPDRCENGLKSQCCIQLGRYTIGICLLCSHSSALK